MVSNLLKFINDLTLDYLDSIFLTLKIWDREAPSRATPVFLSAKVKCAVVMGSAPTRTSARVMNSGTVRNVSFPAKIKRNGSGITVTSQYVLEYHRLMLPLALDMGIVFLLLHVSVILDTLDWIVHSLNVMV
mmetsp:Transcript_10406/g.38608  ORF Transcript_10406/g.38608 Transcript_10406/m.38608 type:complete len:132 (-) Transcript_10406:7946-8341(-)